MILTKQIMAVYNHIAVVPGVCSVDGIQDQPATFDGGPLPALVVDGGDPNQRQHKHPLDAHQLPVIMLWLSRPGQESDDILQHVRGMLRACFGTLTSCNCGSQLAAAFLCSVCKLVSSFGVDYTQSQA